MNIVIRASGSSEIGNGHIWRTLRLARELMDRGHCVSYVCEDLEGAPFDKLDEEEITYKRVSAEKNLVEEVREWAKITGAHWIMTDSYDITKKELEAYSDYKIISIDDVCETEFPVDILVNQQLWAKDFKYKTKENTIKMLGPEYLMMDEVYFEKTNPYRLVMPPKFLVFMGGDAKDYTGEVVKALLKFNFPLEVDVVYNSGYKHLMKLLLYLADNTKIYHTVRLHKNLPNLHGISEDVRLAIIGGGMAAYEMCAMKIPFIIIPQASNQMLSGQYFSRTHACALLYPLPDNGRDAIYNFTKDIIEHPTLLHEMSSIGLRYLFDIRKKIKIELESGIKKIIDKMEEI